MSQGHTMIKQPKYCFAVTGTCGKTSTCYFLYQIFSLLGIMSGYMGSLGLKNNVGLSVSVNNDLTTPGPRDGLHTILEEMHSAGITHLVLEASSHGLFQKRLKNVDLYGVAFTNLSPEHLDYHDDMESLF